MPTVDFSQLPEGPPPDFTYLNSAYVKVYDDGTDRYLANFLGLGDEEPVLWYWSTYAYDIADNDNMHVVEAEVTFTGNDDKIELRFRGASDGSSYHGVRLEQNGAAFWVHEGGGGGFSWTPPALGTKWRFRLEYMGVTSTQTLLRVWVNDSVVYNSVADGFKTGVYAGFQMSAAARMHRWGFPYGIETDGAPQLRWSEQAYADASSVNLPADEVQEGDLLVAWVTSDTNGEGVNFFAPPAGWTEEAEDAALSTYLGWHWKVAGASEPTSYTFTGGGAHLSVAMMIVKAGTFDPDNPIADCNLGIDNVASTVEIAGVTTGADNSLALAGTFAIYQGYPTGPEEFSVVEHISNGWVFTTVVQAELETAGSHGPWTVTSPEPRGAGVIVINPPASAPTGPVFFEDDFNRPDSASFGANWVELADGDGAIVSGQAVLPTGSGESCLAWATEATTAKQFSQHTVTADWTNDTSRGPFIHSDLSSDVAGYMVNWRALDNRWRIWRNQTNVNNVNAGPDIVAGDVIRIESEPSGANLIVRTFHNGNLVNEYTDTSPLTGRHVGFNLRTGQVSADDWSGGDVDAEPIGEPSPRPVDPILVWNFVTGAQDISGNGRHGTVSGASVSDGEVFFTGGASGQYVEWQHGATIPTSAASVLTRVRITDNGHSGGLWTRMRANDSSSFNLALNGDQIEAVVRTSGGVAILGSGTLTWNEEYNVGLVYDGAEAILYVDGVEVDSASLTGTIDMSGGSSFDRFRIGHDPNNPLRVQLGYAVLDLAWYHRALSPTEVADYAPIDEQKEGSNRRIWWNGSWIDPGVTAGRRVWWSGAWVDV